jgi:hypothetical protein
MDNERDRQLARIAATLGADVAGTVNESDLNRVLEAIADRVEAVGWPGGGGSGTTVDFSLHTVDPTAEDIDWDRTQPICNAAIDLSQGGYPTGDYKLQMLAADVQQGTIWVRGDGNAATSFRITNGYYPDYWTPQPIVSYEVHKWFMVDGTCYCTATTYNP